MKLALVFLASLAITRAGEAIHNGIVLPDEWPPRVGGFAGAPPLAVWKKPGELPEPPYLKKKPDVIDISVGRQLFVDDFLIASTTLKRVWHKPVKFSGNPVLKPEKPWELGTTRTPMAAPFSDGCFYDPATKRFMLWYSSAWYDSTALAVSSDGLRWERPSLDVFPGTNKVMLRGRDDWRRDNVSVWLDHDAAKADERFKAIMFCRTGALGAKLDDYHPGLLFLSSPDGIHWTERGTTEHSKDNTTMFYNPFRKMWVFSHRIHIKHDDGRYERARAYWETKDFFSAAGDAFVKRTPVFWSCSDAQDAPGSQVYKIDAAPYESVMLGLFEILSGAPNEVAAAEGRPKQADLQVAFSRDGFHWIRHRETFIGGTQKPGDWDRGYISSCGGCCIVAGDELLFPFGAFAGDATNLNKNIMWSGLYANGATGIAKLRRDGFASMDGTGTLTTEKLRFTGAHLFVNIKDRVRAEVLDADGWPIAPFTLANSISAEADSTKLRMAWRGGDDLSKLRGKAVRFRFEVKDGALFAFWIAKNADGRSDGFVAGGGPEFTRGRDE